MTKLEYLELKEGIKTITNSADPVQIKINVLKAMRKDVREAIRIRNNKSY